MFWKSGPIPMYQFMWYASGMGKGTAGPYIELIASYQLQYRAGCEGQTHGRS